MGMFGASYAAPCHFQPAPAATTAMMRAVSAPPLSPRRSDRSEKTSAIPATAASTHQSLRGRWGSGTRNRIGCMLRFVYKKEAARASQGRHVSQALPLTDASRALGRGVIDRGVVI